MEQIKTVLDDRFYRDSTERTANNSIQLPAEIDCLIDNKMYRNKFRKLIREGYIRDLTELANLAKGKDVPSRWFAKVCAKSRWDGTLKWLAKLRRIAQQAQEIAKRLSIRPEQMKTVYKACWRVSDVLVKAIKAEELGRDKFKYFCWLCAKT